MDSQEFKPAHVQAFNELCQVVGATEMQEIMNSYSKCPSGGHTRTSSPYGAVPQQNVSLYQQAPLQEATDNILALDMYELYTGNCYDYQQTRTSPEGSYWSQGCATPVQYSNVSMHAQHAIPVSFQQDNFQYQTSIPYSCSGSVGAYPTSFSTDPNHLYVKYPAQSSATTTSPIPSVADMTTSTAVNPNGRRIRTIKQIRSQSLSAHDAADSRRCLLSELQSSPEIRQTVTSDLYNLSPNQMTPRRSLTNESLNDSGFGSDVGTPPSVTKDQKMLQSCLISSTSCPLPYNLPLIPCNKPQTMGNKPQTLGNTSVEDVKPVLDIKPSKKRPACDVPINQPSTKKTRHNQPLNNNAVSIMQTWYESHKHNPYPTREQKKTLATMGGISVAQVKSWFANKRNRSNNTRPKVEKQKMEQKLLNICKQLATDSKRPQETNTLIINQLSSLLKVQGNYL